MCADGTAAAHVNDDQTELFIGNARFLGISSCYSLLVERVEDASSGKLRAAGISGYGLQLVHHNGVNDEGRNADGIADLSGEDAAQVGSVLALIADFKVVKQLVAHLIGAARDGL